MFWLKEDYDPDDPLNPARGMLNGVAVSLVIWAVIAAIVGIIKYG